MDDIMANAERPFPRGRAFLYALTCCFSERTTGFEPATPTLARSEKIQLALDNRGQNGPEPATGGLPDQRRCP